MPKKNARTTKTAQRTREEQWRRRLNAQGRSLVESDPLDTEVEAEAEYADTETEGTTVEIIAPASAMTATRRAARAATAPAQPSRPSVATSTAQRRAASMASRSTRLRPAATGMSIDEEMHYVRGDIRRLIILTAICLAVLIALSFVIR